ncbi:MAG TPA: hypothetical protein VNW15_01545 [Rhizomicrobium sp.]|jgi:hypothetical protein|nr:hypothetical protein [Rhizomicrobium sp.]
MKTIYAVIAAASLLATTAMAAPPLAPGKPAGLRQAQDADDDNTVLYIIGIGAVAAGIALLASDNGNGMVTPPTSSSSTTTTTTTKTATSST